MGEVGRWLWSRLIGYRPIRTGSPEAWFVGLAAALVFWTAACEGPLHSRRLTAASPGTGPGTVILDVDVGEGWAWALTCDERCSENDGRRSAGRVLRLDPVSAEIRA